MPPISCLPSTVTSPQSITRESGSCPFIKVQVDEVAPAVAPPGKQLQKPEAHAAAVARHKNTGEDAHHVSD